MTGKGAPGVFWGAGNILGFVVAIVLSWNWLSRCMQFVKINWDIQLWLCAHCVYKQYFYKMFLREKIYISKYQYISISIHTSIRIDTDFKILKLGLHLSLLILGTGVMESLWEKKSTFTSYFLHVCSIGFFKTWNMHHLKLFFLGRRWTFFQASLLISKHTNLL